jgi:putative transposase
MLISLTTFLATLFSIFRLRAALQLENLALRHQIDVLQRSARTRPKLTSGDRLLWICLSHLWRDWRSALAIVKPETVVAWHRAGFRLFWTWKVRRGQPGRPVILREVRDLIRKMCRENPRWGAPRIHGELLKLGIDIGESSVSNYMVRCRSPPISDLAHISGESRQAAGLHRLLHGAHHPFPGPLRVSGVVS